MQRFSTRAEFLEISTSRLLGNPSLRSFGLSRVVAFGGDDRSWDKGGKTEKARWGSIGQNISGRIEGYPRSDLPATLHFGEPQFAHWVAEATLVWLPLSLGISPKSSLWGSWLNTSVTMDTPHSTFSKAAGSSSGGTQGCPEPSSVSFLKSRWERSLSIYFQTHRKLSGRQETSQPGWPHPAQSFADSEAPKQVENIMFYQLSLTARPGNAQPPQRRRESSHSRRKIRKRRRKGKSIQNSHVRRANTDTDISLQSSMPQAAGLCPSGICCVQGRAAVTGHAAHRPHKLQLSKAMSVRGRVPPSHDGRKNPGLVLSLHSVDSSQASFVGYGLITSIQLLSRVVWGLPQKQKLNSPATSGIWGMWGYLSAHWLPLIPYGYTKYIHRICELQE